MKFSNLFTFTSISFAAFLIFSALIVLVKSQNICDENYGQTIPDPDRCDGFIICVLSNPNYVDCPPRTVFNATRRQCVEGNPETCVEYDFEAICSGVFFGARPFPDDYTLFIGCIREFPSVMQCYQYEVFDPSSNMCIFVGPPSTTTTVETTTPVEETTTTETTEESTTTIGTTTWPPNPCSGISNGAAPDPDDCTKCFYCLNQNILPVECACEPGEIFWINECVSGNPETCEPTTTTTTTTLPPNPCSGISNGSAPDPDDCTKCFFCFNQMILPVDCVCDPGQIFWINECVSGNQQTCEPDSF